MGGGRGAPGGPLQQEAVPHTRPSSPCPPPPQGPPGHPGPTSSPCCTSKAWLRPAGLGSQMMLGGPAVGVSQHFHFSLSLPGIPRDVPGCWRGTGLSPPSPPSPAPMPRCYSLLVIRSPASWAAPGTRCYRGGNATPNPPRVLAGEHGDQAWHPASKRGLQDCPPPPTQCFAEISGLLISSAASQPAWYTRRGVRGHGRDADGDVGYWGRGGQGEGARRAGKGRAGKGKGKAATPGGC